MVLFRKRIAKYNMLLKISSFLLVQVLQFFRYVVFLMISVKVYNSAVVVLDV